MVVQANARRRGPGVGLAARAPAPSGTNLYDPLARTLKQAQEREGPTSPRRFCQTVAGGRRMASRPAGRLVRSPAGLRACGPAGLRVCPREVPKIRLAKARAFPDFRACAR